MHVLKKTMILGIAAFLIVLTVLLTIGPVVGGAIDYSATPPTLISPADNAWVTKDKPTFKWSAPDDNQSGFNLQISTVRSFSVIIPNGNITVKSSTQNYTLTTDEALDDGMYYWRVKTNDTSGVWSIWSSPWLVKIDTTPPHPVTDISVGILTKFKIRELEIGGQSINLTWTASDDLYVLRYEIYVSADPSVLGTKIGTTTALYYDQIEIGSKGSEDLIKSTPEGYIFSILNPDTTYYLSVVVVDQAGLPSEAATLSVKTTAPLNWLLMGGIAVAIEVAIAAIFVVIKLFIKKE